MHNTRRVKKRVTHDKHNTRHVKQKSGRKRKSTRGRSNKNNHGKRNTRKKKTVAVFTKRKSDENPRCSPMPKDNDFSCYSNGVLFKLRDRWNITYPKQAITSNEPKEIWTALKDHMSKSCEKESCWLKQHFLTEKEAKMLMNESFAPISPEEWKENPTEWLSSDDILKVMKQYEQAFKCFEFLGPSPIDFNKKELYGECVWEELCHFSLSEQLKRGKTKIGIIFNLDDHNGPGTHWVSMFIDIKKKQIVFFDSAGEAIPKRIEHFVDMVTKQGQKINPPIHFEFDQNHPVEHQYGDTECGVYSIYFIVHMLKDRTNSEYLKTHILPDEFIQNFRKIYFNEEL